MEEKTFASFSPSFYTQIPSCFPSVCMKLKFMSVDRLKRYLCSLSDRQLVFLREQKMKGLVRWVHRLERLTQGNLYVRRCDRIKQETGENIYRVEDFIQSLPQKQEKIFMKQFSLQWEILTIMKTLQERGVSRE
jgi:hypothetical protein